MEYFIEVRGKELVVQAKNFKEINSYGQPKSQGIQETDSGPLQLREGAWLRRLVAHGSADKGNIRSDGRCQERVVRPGRPVGSFCGS